MKSISCPAFIALLFVQSVCNCSGTLSPVLLAGGAADSDKTGCYIVVLKDDITHDRFTAIKSQVVSMTEDEELHGSMEAVVKAFTVKLSDRALSIVSAVINYRRACARVAVVNSFGMLLESKRRCVRCE